MPGKEVKTWNGVVNVRSAQRSSSSLMRSKHYGSYTKARNVRLQSPTSNRVLPHLQIQTGAERQASAPTSSAGHRRAECDTQAGIAPLAAQGRTEFLRGEIGQSTVSLPAFYGRRSSMEERPAVAGMVGGSIPLGDPSTSSG